MTKTVDVEVDLPRALAEAVPLTNQMLAALHALRLESNGVAGYLQPKERWALATLIVAAASGHHSDIHPETLTQLFTMLLDGAVPIPPDAGGQTGGVA